MLRGSCLASLSSLLSVLDGVVAVELRSGLEERQVEGISMAALQDLEPRAVLSVCEAFISGSSNVVRITNVRHLEGNRLQMIFDGFHQIQASHKDNGTNFSAESPHSVWVSETIAPNAQSTSGLGFADPSLYQVLPLMELNVYHNVENPRQCQALCNEVARCKAWVFGLPECSAPDSSYAGKCSVRGSSRAKHPPGTPPLECMVVGSSTANLETRSPASKDAEAYVYQLPQYPHKGPQTQTHRLREQTEELSKDLWSVSRAVARAIDRCLASKLGTWNFQSIEGLLLFAPGGFARLMHYHALDAEGVSHGASRVGLHGVSAGQGDSTYGRWLWREWHCDRSFMTLSTPGMSWAKADGKALKNSETLVYRDRNGELFSVRHESEGSLLVHLGLGAEAAGLGLLACSEHSVAGNEMLQREASTYAEQGRERVFLGIERFWLGVFVQPIPGQLATSHPISFCGDIHVSNDDGEFRFRGGGFWALGDTCPNGHSKQNRYLGQIMAEGRPISVLCCASTTLFNRKYFDIPFSAHRLKIQS
eukprot:TRINITY_DN34006_c0_g1_i1.p1 TRINITY_DN34006_c0_g1~~TRINITY_DN34006_c0_g1_i1.p1  ORF type:complete len:535 (+),score=52.65 TRINITY_DN34006_c0_g1_i1:150-1754(+)